MDEYRNKNLATLVDMLAEHTNEYLSMLREGTTQEKFDECKKTIARLTAEIESRKQKKKDSEKSNTDIHFKAKDRS